MTLPRKTHHELLQAADELRSELVDTVEKLEERRQEGLMPQTRRLRYISIAAGVALAGVLGLVGVGMYRDRIAKPRRRRARWVLLRDMWRHPERAMRGERRSFAVSLLRSVLLSVATGAIAVPVKRAIEGQRANARPRATA